MSLPTRRSRWPWAVAVLAVALGLGGTWQAYLDPGGPSLALSLTQSVLLLAFLGAGAILTSRRSDLAISWIVPLPGLYLFLEPALDLLESVTGPTGDVWLDWAAQVSWGVTFPPVAIFLPLLFPTGAPPSPRWRWLLWTGTGAVALLTIGNAVAPDLLDEGVNPLAVPEAVALPMMAVGGILLVVSFVGAMVSAVVRFRRSTGVERLQLRWFVRGAALVPVGWTVAMATEGTAHQQMGGFALAATLALLPLAITIAVVRYRLYDIDRVVSRVVAYAIVTAILAGVYAAGVLGVGAVLPAGGSDLIVAGSTLAVAAAFRPVRRRVQDVVDRRFARTQHDAAAAVAGFAGRLRDEVQIEAIERDLGEVVRDLWSPTHASVWMRVVQAEPSG